jgi:hypothetical protein
MRRLLLSLGAAAFIAVVSARGAAADGPMFVTQDGAGVAVPGSLRYVAVNTTSGHGTDLVEVSRSDGSVGPALRIPGTWGLPYTPAGAEGLSRDGRTLVLGSAAIGVSSPTRFLLVNARQMHVMRTISLPGYFSYDALSPDASRLYLIQYTHGHSQDTSRYIVRAYDLRTNRLLPGRIADRTQKSWVMHGSPVTRTWSARGRWVYTLYTNPGGYPFIHALDTVRGVAHCIKLPWEEDQSQDGLYNLVLDVHNGGRTLAVHWRSGRPWLQVAVGSWRISEAGGGVPWIWVGAGIGGALALLVAGGALLVRRRRSEELEQHPGQELGLA